MAEMPPTREVGPGPSSRFLLLVALATIGVTLMALGQLWVAPRFNPAEFRLADIPFSMRVYDSAATRRFEITRRDAPGRPPEVIVSSIAPPCAVPWIGLSNVDGKEGLDLVLRDCGEERVITYDPAAGAFYRYAAGGERALRIPLGSRLLLGEIGRQGLGLTTLGFLLDVVAGILIFSGSRRGLNRRMEGGR